MKNLYIFYFLINVVVCYSQNRTLEYKDVTIEFINGKKVILYDKKPYNGYLKYEKENVQCIDVVKEGFVIDNSGCNGKKNLKPIIDNFDKKSKAIQFNKLIYRTEKEQYGTCGSCDTATILVKKAYFKDKIYNGYAKSSDSIFYIEKGIVKTIRILSGDIVLEFFEIKNGKRNGNL